MLKYPSDLNEGVSDSIVFSHTPYRTNSGGAGIPADLSAGGMIRLYVPNSTPGLSQSNSWGRQDFAGEVGKLRADAIKMVTNGINNVGRDGDVKEAIEDGKEVLGKFAGDKINAIPGIARQVGTETAANMIGLSGNKALALARGQVYNPNVELLYNSPQLRSFDFEFNFVPKNSSESRTIDDIIFEFKKWSSPKDPGGTDGVYCIPHVWKVSYSGMVSKKMAKFKLAALVNVTVVENANSQSHATFDDGTPIVTTMRLDFKEVDVITRNDHEDARGSGYSRGY